MALIIQFPNDTTGAQEFAHGSDGRLNVSSRVDVRRYYNSRDESESYSLVWDDASTATGDIVLYWKNTNTNGKHLVISSVGINSQYASDWQLKMTTGTAGS